MDLSLRNRRLWLAGLVCAIFVVCALVIVLSNNPAAPPQEKSAPEPVASVPDGSPEQNSRPHIAPAVKSGSAEQAKRDLVKQLQPEAEKYAEEQQTVQNDSKPHPSNLPGEIISRAYKGKTYDEKIEILKRYLTHPGLTEQDLYLIHRQMAQWLIGTKDYEAASAIYDEMEAHWTDNPEKLLDLKMTRGELDFARGDKEAAIEKLSEIVSLPLPDNPAEFSQTHIILSLAPSRLARYYKEEGDIDKSIDLMDKSIERALELYAQTPESTNLIYIIVSLLGCEIDYELEDNHISVKEARTRLDDMVQRLASESEMSERELFSFSIIPVGDIRSMIDNYEIRKNEGSGVKN